MTTERAALRCENCAGVAWRIETAPYRKEPTGTYSRRYCRQCGAPGPDHFTANSPFKTNWTRSQKEVRGME